MKTIIFALCSMVVGFAQTTQVTITITVPNDVLAAVSAWRLTQTVPGATPQDPPVQKYANNLALLKAALRDTIAQILEASPTPSMSAAKAIIVAKQGEIAEAKATAVQ